VQRLLPDPGPTTVGDQLDGYRPWQEPREERPLVAVNFASTVDGRASIGGVSGPIGSATDTEMLARLRTRFDAVMIGAGTMRAERYGPLPNSPERREERERLGLSPDPLLVIISGRLDLPWDATAFTAGGGEVLIFTASEAEPPETATPVKLIRHDGFVNIVEALRQLHTDHGIKALICEGGPGLHNQLEGAGCVDDLFLTIAPKLAGGEAPRIIEGDLPAVAELELAWLLAEGSELFARYRRR
jgi:riboflavin biosynthesis pyrimidine reductase